jgi:predicted short-subunit dehydrogenase-like oxidoreductase (DUF2520 family)
MRRSVCIIGLGNWGSSLARGLLRAKVPLREVVVTGRRSSLSRDSWMGDLPLTHFYQAKMEADLLWLCVPDGAIAKVTARLLRRVGGRGLAGQIVVHSSGALSGQVLEAAEAAGASVGSVHPLMSFPTRTPVALKGVSFAVEAEAGSRRILNALVRQIGGRPFAIQAESKALYHAVGVLASPLLVSHLAAAQQAAALAGFSPSQARRLLEPITRATLDNFFLKGLGRSFSGPIARGDVATIRLHLQALKPHPMLAGVYRSLALYALEALPGRNRKALRASLRRK